MLDLQLHRSWNRRDGNGFPHYPSKGATMTTRARPSGQEHRDTRQPKGASSARRSGKSPNEGEGSRSAARDYNQRTADFIESRPVNESAEAAEPAGHSR